MAPMFVHEQKLATHAHSASDAESDQNPSSSHSRATSNAVSFLDTSPMTPRGLAFGHQPNSFSPPASIVSFGSGADLPSGVHSGRTSRATSIADFSRVSSYYGAADLALLGSTRSSTRLRETFTSPPMRPLTVHSTAPSVKVERERLKSTMLSSVGVLHKPWTD
jgi:hypothetical protein